MIIPSVGSAGKAEGDVARGDRRAHGGLPSRRVGIRVYSSRVAHENGFRSSETFRIVNTRDECGLAPCADESGMHKTTLVGDDDELRAVSRRELLKDAADVRLGGQRAHV